MAFLSLAKMTGIAVGGAALGALNKQAGRRFLARKLGEMPGITAKVSQALGAGPDGAVSAPQALAVADVARIIASESPALHRDIAAIDGEGLPASIGQVNKVRLRDGRTLAVKVRYPGIAEEIDGQLKGLFALFAKANASKGMGFDVDSYRAYFTDSFRQELDYAGEAATQRQFAELLRGVPGIHIPRVYEEYSTGAVLAQEYVPSKSLDALLALSVEGRSPVAAALARFQMTCLFGTRRVHGDMHPGNWGYDPLAGNLVVYDFGSAFTLSAAQSLGLCRLITASAQVDGRAITPLLVDLGFHRERLAPVEPVLPALCSAIFGPFAAPEAWVPQGASMAAEAARIMGDERWRFRSAGPPWFFSVLRSCSGVLGALERLAIPVPFSSILAEALSGAHSAPPAQPEPASSLCVSVEEDGKSIALLEFPAGAVARLESLMPDQALAHIKGDIDVGEVGRRAIASGLAPQTLFSKDVGRRRYRAWLK